MRGFYQPLSLILSCALGVSEDAKHGSNVIQVFVSVTKALWTHRSIEWNCIFTTTAEIYSRSLVNFYCQYTDRHMNLKFMRRLSEREPSIRQFVIVKKQIDVNFLCICSVIDHDFRHYIFKVVCGSTRLSPRGSTAVLTVWWRNSWSITGQTHKKTDGNLLTLNESKIS